MPLAVFSRTMKNKQRLIIPRVIRVTVSSLLLVTALSFGARAQDLDSRLKEIEEYAAKAGTDWKVPGFALAIVKDDKVIFAKGYGLRELGKPETVDKDTLFAIASNSKAFTSAARPGGA